MDLTTLAVIVAAVVAFFLFKQLGQISSKQARDLVTAGGKVIDVRTPGEFASDHIKQAANLPLDELESRISQIAPDKSQPLLLHCLSGGRSGMAKRKLRAMGYTNVHNLGSLGRARAVLEAAP
jgi:phage shock protein E